MERYRDQRPIPAVNRLTGLGALLLGVAALAVVGCGGGDGGTGSTETGAVTSSSAEDASAAPAGAVDMSAKVDIADFKYGPATVTIRSGGNVTWTNSDSAPHTATADNQKDFNTDTLNTGDSKKITFSKSGTFKYFCLFHPFMHGTVVVVN
jgi:plastocyanin